MSKLRPATRMAIALVLALVSYLLLWPVPIDPVAWDAPVNAGLVDPFESNDRLANAQLIDLGGHSGPEDIAGGPDGKIYTATNDGRIIRFSQSGEQIEVFAETGGRPLGLEFTAAGDLIVANSRTGLQKISPDGSVEILVDEFERRSIGYANDVAIDADGRIYFSEASTKFSASEFGGAYEASLLDLLEHGGHGRVLRHDPATGETMLVVDGLNFANGVAISDDQQYLLINETGSYRVLRHWLRGPYAGTTEVILDNLPGFPDNMNNGLNDRFWLGLVAPRNELLDRLANKPWLRKIVQRLPAPMRPGATPSSHVIAITGDGVVLMDLQDSSARLAALTGVYETRDTLWLSSLFGHHVGRLDKQRLAN